MEESIESVVPADSESVLVYSDLDSLPADLEPVPKDQEFVLVDSKSVPVDPGPLSDDLNPHLPSSQLQRPRQIQSQEMKKTGVLFPVKMEDLEFRHLTIRFWTSSEDDVCLILCEPTQAEVCGLLDSLAALYPSDAPSELASLVIASLRPHSGDEKKSIVGDVARLSELADANDSCEDAKIESLEGHRINGSLCTNNNRDLDAEGNAGFLKRKIAALSPIAASSKSEAFKSNKSRVNGSHSLQTSKRPRLRGSAASFRSTCHRARTGELGSIFRLKPRNDSTINFRGVSGSLRLVARCQPTASTPRDGGRLRLVARKEIIPRISGSLRIVPRGGNVMPQEAESSSSNKSHGSSEESPEAIAAVVKREQPEDDNDGLIPGGRRRKPKFRLPKGYLSAPPSAYTFPRAQEMLDQYAFRRKLTKKGERTAVCGECGEGRHTEMSLRRHLLRQHDYVACKGCRRLFSAAALAEHSCPLRNIACEQCPKRFTTVEGWNSHVEAVHVGTRTICQVCGTIYSNANALRRHLEVRHGILPPPLGHRGQGVPSEAAPFYPCSRCGKQLKNRFSLYEHEHRVHSPSKRPVGPCPYCGRVFCSTWSLSRHVASVHRGQSGDVKAGGGVEQEGGSDVEVEEEEEEEGEDGHHNRREFGMID